MTAITKLSMSQHDSYIAVPYFPKWIKSLDTQQSSRLKNSVWLHSYVPTADLQGTPVQSPARLPRCWDRRRVSAPCVAITTFTALRLKTNISTKPLPLYLNKFTWNTEKKRPFLWAICSGVLANFVQSRSVIIQYSDDFILFHIQDYFIISFDKLNRGWTLTTSQYTLTWHILYILELREELLRLPNVH